MDEFIRLPDAELEVMAVLWGEDEPMSSRQILEALSERKDWGITTLLNLLTRLINRGFVAVEKSGKINQYSVLIPREEYAAEMDRYFLRLLHGGSVLDMLEILAENETVSEHDLADIRRFIDRKEKEKGDVPSWLL